MYVFAYGSLLNMESLRATLPGVESPACFPAVVNGYVRTFDVAFPNDGSQTDKAYFDDEGARPPVVLFANLTQADPGVSLNGVLIPVQPAHVEALSTRELRYGIVDVTAEVRAYDGGSCLQARVATFVGRPEFTHARSVACGVVSQDYFETIVAGVAQWDTRFPGFRPDFEASTRAPAPDQVVPLRRVDRPARADAHHRGRRS